MVAILEMNQKFKILQTGNFYFPLKDKNKKFVVVNTFSLYSQTKELIQIYKMICKMKKKFKLGEDFSILSRLVWAIIEEHKKGFKNIDWLVPIRLEISGKDTLMLDVDLLKEVRK